MMMVVFLFFSSYTKIKSKPTNGKTQINCFNSFEHRLEIVSWYMAKKKKQNAGKTNAIISQWMNEWNHWTKLLRWFTASIRNDCFFSLSPFVFLMCIIICTQFPSGIFWQYPIHIVTVQQTTFSLFVLSISFKIVGMIKAFAIVSQMSIKRNLYFHLVSVHFRKGKCWS